MRQQKINYQKELEKTLEAIRREERVPTLLLHSCCGPCSSYVMEYLADFCGLLSFILTRILRIRKNTGSVPKSSAVSLNG